MVLSDLTFNHQFNEVAPPTAIFSAKAFLSRNGQRLMLGQWRHFTYEKRTGEMVSIDDMRDGHLGPKLQDCDFDTAMQVKPLMHSAPPPI